MNKKTEKDPWLLASSLSEKTKIGKDEIVKLYKKRMQIEEGFRDLKSSRYGLGFEQAYSKKIERIEIFLLLAMLACLIAYVAGIAAEQEELHMPFQINTIRNRRVLSYFFLGCRIIVKKIKSSPIALDKAQNWIKLHAGRDNYASIL